MLNLSFAKPKGLIPRQLFLGEMRNISPEINYCIRSKGKLGFARKTFASPVSRNQFYSLRMRKEWEKSIESLIITRHNMLELVYTIKISVITVGILHR